MSERLVILVEQNPGLRERIREVLTAHEFKVEAPSDGKELLTNRQWRPVLIILCIDPKKLGWTLCNLIKKTVQYRDVPLFITSNEATDKDFEDHKKLRTRAELYLFKPYSLEALLDNIDQFIGLRLPSIPPDQEPDDDFIEASDPVEAAIPDEPDIEEIPRRSTHQSPVEGPPLGVDSECSPEVAACAAIPQYDYEDSIERAFSKLDRGCFGVNAPRQMLIEQAVKIHAVAIRDRLKRALLEEAMKSSASHIEETLLGRIVRVELVPDRAEEFTVVALSEHEQPVLRDELTHWEWSVTAHRCGSRQLLRVRATNCVDVAGKTLRKSHPVRTIEVDVAVMSVGETHAETAPLDKPRLRKLLNQVLPTDADMEAFCLDYFPALFLRFSHGMERTQKLTLLLAHTPGSQLQRLLTEAYPVAVEAFLERVE